jgi:hypothetical protein
MTAAQASRYLTTAGFPDLSVFKMGGVYYLLGDDGVTNQAAERCLHVVRQADITPQLLAWKLAELTGAGSP